MTKFVTPKQLRNIRSGQNVYYVTLNQFGVYKVRSILAIGKKVKSYLDPWTENEKRFVCKNDKTPLAVNGTHWFKNSDIALFKTVHGAERFIEETKLGLKFKFKVFSIVSRVRRQMPMDSSLFNQPYAVPLRPQVVISPYAN